MNDHSETDSSGLHLHDSPDNTASIGSVKANISGSYRWRLAIIGVGFCLFGLYCLYDGFIAYPRKQQIGLEYQRHMDEGRLAEWEAYATKRGWPTDSPKMISDMSIYTQFIMAAIVFPIGIIFTVAFVRSLNRYVAMDHTGLSTQAGLRCRFEQITGLDIRRWKTKGIAIVQFKNDDGQPRLITLDDWKYDRDATATIYNRVAQHLGVADSPGVDEATPVPKPSA